MVSVVDNNLIVTRTVRPNDQSAILMIIKMIVPLRVATWSSWYQGERDQNSISWVFGLIDYLVNRNAWQQGKPWNIRTSVSKFVVFSIHFVKLIRRKWSQGILWELQYIRRFNMAGSGSLVFGHYPFILSLKKTIKVITIMPKNSTQWSH